MTYFTTNNYLPDVGGNEFESFVLTMEILMTSLLTINDALETKYIAHEVDFSSIC